MNRMIRSSGRRTKAALLLTASWTVLWCLSTTILVSLVWLFFERDAPGPFPPMPLVTFIQLYAIYALGVGVVAGALFAISLVYVAPRVDGSSPVNLDRTVVHRGAATGALAGLAVGFLGMSSGAIGAILLLGFGASMGWLSAMFSVKWPRHFEGELPTRSDVPRHSTDLLANRETLHDSNIETQVAEPIQRFRAKNG